MYCLAEKAAAEENWEEARKHLTQAWAIPDLPLDLEEINMVILAYRLCKRQPDIDREFKNKMDSKHKQLWQYILQDYDRTPIEFRLEKIPSVCNSAAWLLANTDGDYLSALALVQAALKIVPDDASILDTLAHVYFLGGKIDEAIRTQEQVVRMAPEATFFRQVLERFKQAKE
jgi:tetratricopeptide (TPR) repeat protein